MFKLKWRVYTRHFIEIHYLSCGNGLTAIYVEKQQQG